MTWRCLKVSAGLAVGCAVAVGCGGSVVSAGGTGGASGTGGVGASAGSGGVGASSGSGGVGASPGSGGVGGSAGGSIVPPPPSNVPPNIDQGKTVIAVSRFYVGDTNRQGQPDPTAWKSYGYNLDDLVSTGQNQNHCTPVPGASPVDVKTDGYGGIDNSFGENLVPMFTSLTSDLSGGINQWLADGKGTQIITLVNFLDPAHVPNQNGISGAGYVGADKGSPAAFTGGDIWPVTYESVTGGNINAPILVFPKSYVSGGVWVSGAASNFVLTLDSTSFPLVLPLSRAVITMRIQGTGYEASAVDGTIAGVMNTEAYIASFKKIAGRIDTSLCDGATLDSIVQQIRAASDIMSDGSNGDPTKTCDAISVGIGFNGFAAQMSTVAPPVQPTPNPCAP